MWRDWIAVTTFTLNHNMRTVSDCQTSSITTLINCVHDFRQDARRWQTFWQIVCRPITINAFQAVRALNVVAAVTKERNSNAVLDFVHRSQGTCGWLDGIDNYVRRCHFIIFSMFNAWNKARFCENKNQQKDFQEIKVFYSKCNEASLASKRLCCISQLSLLFECLSCSHYCK